MEMRFGNGGWVGVRDVGLDALLYVRFVEDTPGRLRLSETYIDGRSAPVDLSEIRHLPLELIEAVANDEPELVLRRMNVPAPDLSTLASYFGTSFGQVWRQVAQGNWVVASFVAQHIDNGKTRETDPESGTSVMRVKKQQNWLGSDAAIPESEFRLQEGPTNGLTDEFLRDVAKAYRAATLRGERPNKSIQEQLGGEAAGIPLKTVQRWVFTARQRGIMPEGKKGRAV